MAFDPTEWEPAAAPVAAAPEPAAETPNYINWQTQSYGAGGKGMDPNFTADLSLLAQDFYNVYGRPLRINSGYRPTWRQAEIYASGVRPAARPGHSRHERGQAVDIYEKDLADLMKLPISDYGFETLARINDPNHLQYAGNYTPVDKERLAGKIAAGETPPEVLEAEQKGLAERAAFNPDDWKPTESSIDDFVPTEQAAVAKPAPAAGIFGTHIQLGAPGGPLETAAKEMQRTTQAGEAPFVPNVAGLFQMGSQKRLEAEKRGLYGSMSHFADKFLGNAVDLFGKALDALGPIANEAGVPVETRPEPSTSTGYIEAAFEKAAFDKKYPYLAPAIKDKPLTPGAELVKPVSDWLREQARKMAPEGKSETFEEKVFEGLGQLPMMLMKYGIPIKALGTVTGMVAVDLIEASDKSPMEILEAGVGALTTGTVLKGVEPLTMKAKVGTVAGLFGFMSWLKGGDTTDVTSSTALGAMLGMMGGRGNLTAKEAISDAFKDFKKEYGRLTPEKQAEGWEAVKPDKVQQEKWEEGLREGAFRKATPEDLAKDVEPPIAEVSKAEAAKEMPPSETSIGPFKAVRRGGRTVLQPFEKAEQPNLFEQGWVPGRKPTDIWYPLDEKPVAPEGEPDVPGYAPPGFMHTFRGPATTMYDFAERNLPFIKTFIRTAKNSLDSTPVFLGSKYNTGELAVPKEGGILAAKQTEKYATDPIYRAEVDGLIDRISSDIVDANNKVDLLEDSITHRYSGGPDTREWIKKARGMLLGNDPLMSVKKGEVGPGGKVKATYGVDVTRAWNMEAKNKYGNWNLGDIAVRECLQNSTDAITKALQNKEIKKGSIDIKTTPKSYTISDNGIGMSDVDIRDKFLALHGSGSDKEGYIGGFGIAKAVILGPAESAKWKLTTRDNYFDGDMASAFDEIKSAKRRQGTEISVSTGEYIVTSKAKQFAETSEYPKNLSVTYNGETVKDPFKGLRHKTEYSGAAGEGTTITIRYYPKAPAGYEQKIVGRLEAPGTGVKLTQMLEQIFNNDFKGAIVADIASNRTPGMSGYPFNDSRNSLKSEAHAKVQAVISKYGTDVLSAQRAGIEAERGPASKAGSVIKDSVAEVAKDEGVKAVADAAKFAGVEVTPINQMDVRRDIGTPVPAITPEQAKLTSAMEGTLRLTAKLLDIPIGKFYLRSAGVVDGGVVIGEWSNGDFGFNWTTPPPEVFTNPVDCYLYLKELVDHELTHHYVGPHNEAFTSRHGSIIKAGDEKLMNSTLALAEAVTGKKASMIREAPSQTEVLKQLSPQQRSLFAEQSGGFDYGRRPELLEPTGTDRPEPQRPLPGTEPRGAIGKGPGEEILPEVGRPRELQVRPSAERTGPGSLPAKSAARARGVVEGLEELDRLEPGEVPGKELLVERPEPPLDFPIGNAHIENDTLHLNQVYVNPKGRGLGKGRSEVEKVIDQAAVRGATKARVVASDESVGFWEKMGFEKTGERSEKLKASAMERPITPKIDMFSGSPDTSEWFKDVWNAVKESRTARGSSIEWTTLGEKLSNLWEKLRVPVGDWGDYQKLSNKYLGELQVAGYENEMMIRRLNKAVPDKVRQAAITNWIEAGGDPQLLKARAEGTKDPVLRRGYEDAINLSEKELDVAREAVAFYDKMLKEGQAAGILESALANYINHIWKKGSQTAQRLQGEVNAGLLNTNFSYARKRIWSTYFEGEQAGRLPKDKSVSYLMGKYFQAFHEAVAARQAIRSLVEGKTADGMPIVTAVGGGDPVPKMMPEESRAFEDVPPDYDMTGKPQGPDAYLIKPRKLTAEQRANYKFIDHPALRKWKWIGDYGTGAPILMEGDLWVHKDHYKHLSNMLKKSAIREHWLGGPVMTAMGSLKGTLLAGSPFHAVHVGSHGLMHMVNITDLPELDFSKPLQREAVQHGLMVYNRRGLQEFGEGLATTGLVNKIPLVGDVSRVIGEYTFESFIPRLKMRLFEEAFERNMRRYSDKYSRDQILELTANQSNAAFGELNYKAMGRNPTMQDIFRILALAPDFLEARARFVGQALKPGGREQALALLRGSVALAGTAAIGSMLFGDKEHGEMGGWNWKEPFTMNLGKKKYTIRSVPGDLLHLITNPRNFAFWRLNPSTVRPLIEMTYGRDVWGRKRSFPQQVGDYFSSHVPIPAQPLVPSLKRETSLIDGALRSIGVASYPFKTAADQAMMDYFMEARIDRPSTSEMEAVQQARRKVLKLAREGKENEAVEIVRKTGEKYKLSPVKALDWLMEAQHPENVANFKRLPLEVMARVMNLAEPAEEQAFIPILLDKISDAKPDKLEMALPELERYMESAERKRKRQAPAAAPAPAAAAPAPPAVEPAPRPFSILGGR